jgi:hypothetical protein
MLTLHIKKDCSVDVRFPRDEGRLKATTHFLRLIRDVTGRVKKIDYEDA